MVGRGVRRDRRAHCGRPGAGGHARHAPRGGLRGAGGARGRVPAVGCPGGADPPAGSGPGLPGGAGAGHRGRRLAGRCGDVPDVHRVRTGVDAAGVDQAGSGGLCGAHRVGDDRHRRGLRLRAGRGARRGATDVGDAPVRDRAGALVPPRDAACRGTCAPSRRAACRSGGAGPDQPRGGCRGRARAPRSRDPRHPGPRLHERRHAGSGGDGRPGPRGRRRRAGTAARGRGDSAREPGRGPGTRRGLRARGVAGRVAPAGTGAAHGAVRPGDERGGELRGQRSRAAAARDRGGAAAGGPGGPVERPPARAGDDRRCAPGPGRGRRDAHRGRRRAGLRARRRRRVRAGRDARPGAVGGWHAVGRVHARQRDDAAGTGPGRRDRARLRHG